MLQEGDWREREFFIDNLLVRIHFINVMIRWTGLAPWEFKFPLTQLMGRPKSCTPKQIAAGGGLDVQRGGVAGKEGTT